MPSDEQGAPCFGDTGGSDAEEAVLCYNRGTMRKIEWLWQSVAGNVVWVILALGAGLMYALLRGEDPLLAARLLYGMVASCAVLVVWLALKCLSAARGIEDALRQDREDRKEVLRKAEAERVTPQNVEAKVRDWLREAKLEVTDVPQPKESEATFLFRVKTSLQPQVLWASVAGLVDTPYLLLRSTVGLSERHQVALNKLHPEALNRVALATRIEVLSAGLEFDIQLPEGVILSRKVPIAPDLTGFTFRERFDQFAMAVLLFRDRISLGLDALGQRIAEAMAAQEAEASPCESEVPSLSGVSPSVSPPPNSPTSAT